MKHTLFLLSVFSILLFAGCNKDKITLKIVSPMDGETFKMYEEIKVNVTAETKKGSIIQVQLTVDNFTTMSLSARPYNFQIPAYTFEKEGIYFLSVMAYSTEGVQEGAAIEIIIEK